MLSKYRRKEQDSQSTFIKSVLLWVPTLPLQSCSPLFSGPFSLCVHTFDFFANDNYSNMCSNDAHASLELLKSIF